MASSTGIPWSANQGDRERQFALAIEQLIHQAQAPAPAPAPGPPKQALPHLDKFNGSPEDLEPWLLSAEAKLHKDGAAIGDPTDQFHYLYLCLSPAVKRTVLPFAKVPGNKIPSRLYEKLRESYGEPNAIQKAAQDLANLVQHDNEGISPFLNKFEELLYRANASTWPDDAKITSLVASLNKRWKRKLAEHTDVPERYSALLTYLRKLGSNAFLTGTGAPAAYHPGHQRGQSMAGDPMQVDIAAVRARTSGAPPAGAPTGAQIAPTQRKQWRKEGRCTGCGSKDHWSRDCPQSSEPRSTPRINTTRINAIDIGSNTVRTYALRTGPSARDDDDDDGDSEFDDDYYNPDVLS